VPAVRFSPLAVALAMAINTLAHAQILPDRSAPGQQQPTVLSTGNGVPLVNIQTPSSSGVSLNVYRQFDVDPRGAILNNARGPTRTQLGGYVQGNPWLATGTARVIVNQVNSTHPSYLRGVVEVAGDRAQVVIANPAGITCSGCGFINANRATLATGTPVMSSGNLEAYRVAGGKVTVDGAGLDASQVEYADIIARAVKVNAGIWAQKLKVTAGLNTVSADQGSVTPGVAASDAAPVKAIDVARLGGMYAGHIYLMSTEHGVGVSNAGHLGAAAGDAVVTSDGRLEHRGSLSANRKLVESITHGGRIAAAGNMTVATAGTFINAGTLAAGNGLSLTAATIDNRATGSLLANTLKLEATGVHTFTNRGLLDSAHTVIDSSTVDNIGTGRIYGDNVAIGAEVLNNLAETVDATTTAAVIAARNRLDIGVGVINNSEHALLYTAGDMAIGGALDAGKRAGGVAREINNSSATINADGDLSIAADTINNSNAHLDIRQRTGAGKRIISYRPNGSPTLINAQQAILRDKDSGQTLDPLDWRAMGDEDNFRLILPAEGHRAVSEWTIYDGIEQITRTVVTRSDPGMITSSGNMRLAAGTVNNYASQIIAGGTVAGDAVNGTAIHNTGPLGEQSVSSTGSATYTFIKRHRWRADDRRYEDAPYQSQTIVTRFALDVTPTHGAAPGRHATVRADASNAFAQAAGVPLRALPDNALYRTDTTPAKRYLVETDPQFTNYRNWLSSDFMLKQRQSTPDSIIKRLGDGYYEQQLVQQQIQQAVGQRYLAGYTSNEAQYMALMNSGVQQAQAFDYTVGIALTEKQMAQLTSDMVWMVKQKVTLSDGSTQEVLAPQVYLRASNVAVTGQGTLMAGTNVAFKTAQEIVNRGGTIAARENTLLAADTVQNLGGRISGTNITLAAANDINNLGGAIEGSHSVSLLAQRDIHTNSTSVDTTNAVTRGTNIDQVSRIRGKDITLAAGRDLTANAADMDAAGDLSLTAGRNLRLGTVIQKYRQQIDWATDHGASNWVRALAGPNRDDQANGAYGTGERGVNRATLSASQEVATRIKGNNIKLSAGQDLVAKGAQVVAETALNASAGRDLTLTTANESASARDQHQHSNAGILTATSVRTDDAGSYSRQNGSTFSGNTTVLSAQRDASVSGSDVVSTKGTQITAGNDLKLAAAADTSRQSNFRKEITAGVFSGGGLGVTVGSKTRSGDFTRNSSTASASTVGATEGDVRLVAGGQYRQMGSDVLAPGGDIDLVAKTVKIIAAADASKTITQDRSKQRGVTLALTSPIISALQTVQQMSDAAGKTKDGRMKALAAATAAMSMVDAVQGAQAAAADPKSAGFGVSITAGGSQSASTTEQNSLLQKASRVASGGNTSVQAKDDGDGADSDITVQSSEVTAGGNLVLKADNDIHLLATQNVDEQHSDRSSSSYGVGLAVQFGQGGASFGITANAAGSRGNSDGRDVANTHRRVKAGGQATLESGRDANLVGATVEGNKVVAEVGRNLNITSVQDTSTFRSRDQSIGGSVTAGAGFSGSVSASQGKVDADYASVGEQSGIEAGDDGFEIKVRGNTDLKGGKIASTDKAVEDSKNSLSTGTLMASEIENRSQYKAESLSVSVGGSAAKPGGGIGIGSTSGGETSVTRSGVSGAAVTITDAQAQQEQIGQSAEQVIASLDRDVRSGKDTSKTLNKNWNGDELRQEVEAQAKITQAFGQRAAKSIGDYASAQYQKAVANGDEEDIKNWGEGGSYRVALHTLAGGLTGGVAGAAGAGLSAATIPDIAQAIQELDLPEGVNKGLIAAAGTAVNAVVGGTQGAASGFNQTLNNYLKHDEIEALARARKTCSASGANNTACGEVKRLEALDKQRDIAVNACSGNTSAACDTVRQDVLKAAADIVRYGTARSDLLSPLDSQHTKDMALSTMSSLDEIEGRAAGLASGTGEMVKDMTEVFFKLLQASTGGDQAQEDIACGFGNILKLLDPVTLSQVIETASTERRNAIADAYERGDSFALGKLTGDLLSGLVPFPAGMIGKAGKAFDEAADVAKMAGKSLTEPATIAKGAGSGVATMGAVVDANFAQSTIRASEIFTKDGIAKYSHLAGRPINTVDDLVNALRNGDIKHSQVPVDYVVSKSGGKLILNTRTSVALDRAGIPKSDWYGVNKTGLPIPDMPGKIFDDLAMDQIRNNKLPSTGTPTIPKGKK